MLNPRQLYKHAAILRARYSDQSEDTESAIAQADMMEAQADLTDLTETGQAGTSDDCTLTDDYPIIGKTIRRGGSIVSIERPWTDDDIDRLEARGVALNWEWCHDPRAGLGQGALIRIYAGTKTDGPSAVWHRGKWTAIKSRGNFGKNWASGGNWLSSRQTSINLADISSNINNSIHKVINMSDKIAKAKARLEAARLRIHACQQMDYAGACARQANNPAYDGQESICTAKAGTFEAHAAKTRAQADLVEAEAGL